MNSGGGGMGIDDDELVVANEEDRVGRKRNCIGEIWWQFFSAFVVKANGYVCLHPDWK